MLLKLNDHKEKNKDETIEITDTDTLNCDVTISKIIVPLITHYYNHSLKLGVYKIVDDDDLPENFYIYNKNENESLELNKWLSVLNEICLYFENHSYDQEENQNKKGLFLFYKYFERLSIS